MMKFSATLKVIYLIGLLACLASCSSRPSSVISSTSPLPAGVRGTVETDGTDCAYHFLGIIPVSSSANSAEALKKAKTKVDVDVLTDVTVDHFGGYYILFSNNCVRVNGMGVPRAVLADKSNSSELKKGANTHVNPKVRFNRRN